jgi:hypothetical protein
MGPVSQARKRHGQLDLQPALPGMPADRLVALILVRLTVGGDEPPGRLPALTPLPTVYACGIKVVTSPGKTMSAPADRHPALGQAGFHLGESVPERLHPALFVPAFPLCGVAADAASALPVGTARRRTIRAILDRRLRASARRFRSASSQASSLVRVIAPAHRDEHNPVIARLRSRRATPWPLVFRRPSEQRAAKSAPARRPRWAPTAARTASSPGDTGTRVRTRAPAGGATTNGAAISRKRRRFTTTSSSAGMTD